MIKVASWGRLSHPLHQLKILGHQPSVAQVISASKPGICLGMGRSYGDVCLNPGGTLWQTTQLDRFISFDAERGVLRCEAGALLRDIQRYLVPRGWMLPVTPGTELITVGGAIANDVHGKNHHRMGCFGEHVKSFRLARTDGHIVDCQADGSAVSQGLYRATIGGLGLTGVILDVELQLRPVESPWLHTETLPYGSLTEFFDLSAQSEDDWEYTVSWIDCLSGRQPRGIFLRANHCTEAAAQGATTRTARTRAMPITPPVSLVNRFSLKPFNALYYASQKRKAGPGFSHYQPFFYPLDSISEWNRMYGPRGFYQYQCVVPEADAGDAISALLETIARNGQGSFLAVLKTFGQRPSPGMLSFPMPGATLALDFPNRGEATLRLFKQLDAVVSKAGGRLYAAKDARMPPDLFHNSYPKLADFIPWRDPGISSAMSRRLLDR